jgi:hypothetical protein
MVAAYQFRSADSELPQPRKGGVGRQHRAQRVLKVRVPSIPCRGMQQRTACTRAHTGTSTLDPLLERLSRDFVDDAYLPARLQSLLRVAA